MDLTADDLAPGDGRSARLDLGTLRIDEIASADDPLFPVVYGHLGAHFTRGDSLEQFYILAQRLSWPAETGMRYRMCLVRDAAGNLAAVRDHTVIASPGRSACTVHLSHLFVAEGWRRSGLAGWMRAWPIGAARGCLGSTAQVTLVAEMDSPDAMKAYARAGFFQADPARVQYYQPDFRAAAAIDASGGPRPVPFTLVIRRVGREAETSISPAALRALVSDLYRMYGATSRAEDLPTLDAYPPDDAPPIRLLAPG